MPTYEYKCLSCGYEFEQFQSITTKPIRKCPKCRKASVKRLIGVGAGVIFKGSGFYQTDYRSESYKKAAEKEKLVSAELAGARSPTCKDTKKPVSARPNLDGKETSAESKDTKPTEKAEPGTKEKNTQSRRGC